MMIDDVSVYRHANVTTLTTYVFDQMDKFSVIHSYSSVIIPVAGRLLKMYYYYCTIVLVYIHGRQERKSYLISPCRRSGFVTYTGSKE
jgi:hypothetical protein